MKNFLCAFAIALFFATPAFAQCTGWPVHCTGIHPGGGAGMSGAVGAAIGEAIGEALVRAAQPKGVSPQTVALDVEGVKYANAGDAYWQKGDCAHAAPLLRQALPYFQKALAIENDEMIQYNLRSTKLKLGWCAASPIEMRGVNFLKAGDAYLEKGKCEQALLAWQKALSYFEQAKAIQAASVFLEDIKKTDARIQKMLSSGYDDKCTGVVANTAIKVLRYATGQLRYRPNDRRGWNKSACHVDQVTNELLYWDAQKKEWALVPKESTGMMCPVGGGKRG